MRILHLVNHALPVVDGYAIRTAQLTAALQNLGHDVAVLVSPRGPAPLEARPTGVGEHQHVPYYYSSASGAPKGGLLGEITFFANFARRWAGQWCPDIVHVHTPCLWGLATLWAGLHHNGPIVYELRGLWEEGAVDLGRQQRGGPRYRWSKQAETFVAKKADAVCVISNALRYEMIQRGIPAHKIVVVPNGIAESSQLAANLGSAEEANGTPYRILYLGSLYRWEGVDVLLHAAALLRGQAPPFLLDIVGDGPQRDDLVALAGSLHLNECVRFHGTVPPEQTALWYRQAHVLVYPRRPTRQTELITPLKPLEAMLYGKPIVASNVGGLRELCPPDVAVFVTPDSAEALATAIRELLGSPSRRVALGQAARNYVLSQRRWTQIVSNYLEAYRRARRHARLRGAPIRNGAPRPPKFVVS
jgi:glycosyltransferase involved in cell wall biosynthesis